MLVKSQGSVDFESLIALMDRAKKARNSGGGFLDGQEMSESEGFGKLGKPKSHSGDVLGRQ